MAAGTLTEEVIEQVAEHLEETAEATRMLDARVIGFCLTGATIGAVVGFIFGYRYNKEKIRAEVFEQSEIELEKIREVYRNRVTEIPLVVPEKEDLNAIIEERGYSIKEINKDAETVDIDAAQSERPLKAPVPIDPSKTVKTVIRTAEGEKDKNDNWSYPSEMAQRSVEKPFIIHQDEYSGNDTEYTQVTYTYYEGDQVLAEIDDTPVTNVDDVVGLNNLKKFGHGSDDQNIVYIRNSRLELEIEVCRSHGSFENEVEGLEHSDVTFERIRRNRHGSDIDDAD